MTFSVKIDGQTLSNGISVFPFSFGQLLDERLDEAYLHITKSTVPVYKPTTPVQIIINEDGALTTFDYILASDNAREVPIGSLPRLFRHDIHLIETTKLMEGIYCQSITFTNSLGNNYLGAAAPAEPYNIPGQYAYNSTGAIFTKPYYTTNVKLFSTPFSDSSLTIPSLRSVAAMIDDNPISSRDAGSQQTQIVIQKDNETITITDPDESRVVTGISSSISIEYTIFTSFSVLDPDQGTVTNYYGYKFSYNLLKAENVLPLQPLTVTDCIERVLELATPLFGNPVSQANAIQTGTNYVQPKFRLNAAQAEQFRKIPAAEFTMTMCTLREALRVVGGYIHAEPRAKPIGSGLYEVYFDMYGTAAESEEITNETTYVYNGVTHDISEYCTQVDTSASNLVNALNYAQGVVFSPDRSNAKTVRTESIYTRLTEENGYIETDFPIQDIVKVESSFYKNGNLAMPFKNITPYIFTATDYNASLSTFGGGYPRARSYALYYDIGQKGIRGLFFKEDSVQGSIYTYLEHYSIVNILAAASGYSPEAIKNEIENDYTQLVFRVSYVPIYNTRFAHGKQEVNDGEEYTQIYNQSENLIESRWFGENVKGVAARLGNVEQTRTYIFNRLSRIPKVGMLLNVGTANTPDYYAISAVNTEAMPTYYKTTVALTKDFNRISEYIAINQQKRTYEVSEREAYLRNILLKEYAIVGKDGNYTAGIFKSPVGVMSAFTYANINNLAITTAVCWGGTYSNPFLVGGQTSGTAPLPLVALPVVSSAFGNSLVFSWGYKDNYSAGTNLTAQTVGDVSGKWLQDVAYCDAYGRMPYYNFFLLNNMNTPDLGYDFAMKAPYVQSQRIDGQGGFNRESSEIKTSNLAPYLIRKDSREILNFNFELEFKTNVNNLTIGSGIASASQLVGATHGFAVFHGLNEKISRFDRIYPEEGGTQLGVPGSPGYNPANGSVSVVDGKVAIKLPTGAQNYTAWVISTPYVAGTPYQVEDERGNITTYTPHTGGEIILSCNNPAALYAELGNSNTIFINLSKSQKEEPQ